MRVAASMAASSAARACSSLRVAGSVYRGIARFNTIARAGPALAIAPPANRSQPAERRGKRPRRVISAGRLLYAVAPSTRTLWRRGHGRRIMSIHVRPASLQDGLAVLGLLEAVGYYPEPISFAKTYRKTLADPHFLVRVAEVGGKVVGVASLSMRYQLGLGGLLACLDELAIAPD